MDRPADALSGTYPIRRGDVDLIIKHLSLHEIGAFVFGIHKAELRWRTVNDEFYLSKRWRKKRAAILRRDGYMCRECRRYGRMQPASIVHHIKHREEFPELAFDDENLISLCAKCHNKAHPEKGGNKCPPSMN